MTARTEPADAAAPRAGTHPTEGPAQLWPSALPWLAGYALLRVLLGLIRLPDALNPLAVGFASLAVSAAVIFLASATLAVMVRQPLGAAALAQLFLAGLVLFGSSLALQRPMLADQWLFGGQPVLLGIARGLPPPAALGLAAAHDAGVICLGAAIGSAVALLIRDRNILLPAGTFAAFADYFMVKWGTVHVALQTPAGAKVVQQMSAGVPAVHHSLQPITMGMADFVFLAFFLACARRFEMNYRGTFLALATVLALLLFAIPWLRQFPAVAPMALAFVLVNLRYFKLTRAEVHATALVFALMAALVGVFFWSGGGK
jgi:hypothetical protein